MRAALSQALHRLVTDTRENPSPTFVAQAVADLVDVWAESALAMIDAASSGRPVPVAAAPAHGAAAGAVSNPDDVHAALLAALGLIVEATRAGSPDIDSACVRLADTFSACLRDAIAGAYLRTTAALEERLGIPPGIAN
jgi:hypothetical protein